MNSDDKILAAVATCVFAAGGALATLFVIAGGRVEAPSVVEERPVAARSQTTAPPGSDVQHAENVNRQSLGDDALRYTVAKLSSHPELASWLMNDELTERFVRAVEAVAQGSSPRAGLDFLAPQGQFLVHDYKLDYAIAQGTYRRFDVVADVFTSLDVDGVVSTFWKVAPSIDRDFAHASWAGEGFEQQLEQAVAHLLEVDVPDGPIEVERRAIAYEFAEDDLQRLSEAQKQLLRMGPRNAKKIQEKLREIQNAFGWNTEATSGIVTAENQGVSSDVELNPGLIAAVAIGAADQTGPPPTLAISAAELEAAVEADLQPPAAASEAPKNGAEGSTESTTEPDDLR
jgi:hypothetical protein